VSFRAPGRRSGTEPVYARRTRRRPALRAALAGSGRTTRGVEPQPSARQAGLGPSRTGLS
jgi:hypothetical protein